MRQKVEFGVCAGGRGNRVEQRGDSHEANLTISAELKRCPGAEMAH